MKNYMVFIYFVHGEYYVEAYPLNNRPLEFVNDFKERYFFVTAKSTNQARKAGYKKFVRSSGRGFNKLPRSLTYVRFRAFRRKSDVRKSKGRHS